MTLRGYPTGAPSRSNDWFHSYTPLVDGKLYESSLNCYNQASCEIQFFFHKQYWKNLNKVKEKWTSISFSVFRHFCNKQFPDNYVLYCFSDIYEFFFCFRISKLFSYFRYLFYLQFLMIHVFSYLKCCCYNNFHILCYFLIFLLILNTDKKKKKLKNILD